MPNSYVHKGGGRRRSSDEQQASLRLRKVNLDLLPVLAELLDTRSVTRTAQRFGMTQPAISRALRQLRAAFDDPLLVSPGRLARLTDRAESLRMPLAQALADLDALLSPTTPFDPPNEAVHFIVNTADYVIQLFAPILCELCAREAPRVVLEFAVTATRTQEDLAAIDYLLGPATLGLTLGKRVGRLPLWRDEVVCIASSENEAIPALITPTQFQAQRYAAFRRALGIPDEMSALVQPTFPLETDPVCIVPSFLALGALVARSDCLALVPRKVAQQLIRSTSLRIIEIIYPTKQIDVSAFWSPATEKRRGRDWFRGLLARAAARLAEERGE